MWPEESLKMSKLFPGKKIGNLLEATDGSHTILDMIIDGLLNLKSKCKLVTLDLCCVPASSKSVQSCNLKMFYFSQCHFI